MRQLLSVRWPLRVGVAVTVVMTIWAISAAGGRPSAFPGKNGKVMFLSDRAAASAFDLYLVNADGSGVQRLTTDGKSGGAAFSADVSGLSLPASGTETRRSTR